MTKHQCYINSLKHIGKTFEEEKNVLAEATIGEKIGDNLYVAEYNGIKCTAIFNPFVGRYYVDDVYGILPEKP